MHASLTLHIFTFYSILNYLTRKSLHFYAHVFSNIEQNISSRTVRSAGKQEPVDSMEALQMTVID